MLEPVERAAAKACRLEARRAVTLSGAPPSEGALASMLEASPRNANLRCLRAARAVAEHDVDAVVLTGDCTDDGDGWELVEGAFRTWHERGRLFVIPGNHDLYLFPIASSARPRPTQQSKLARWHEFAARAGLDLDACGAWSRVVEEAKAVFVGLNSCSRRQRAFYRQNGAIGPAQLEWLRALAKTPAWKNARHRVVLFHHHVVPLPHGVGRRAPTEIGMRLDDARAFAEALADVGATLVMHGHRHISERRHPGRRALVLARRARRARPRRTRAHPGRGGRAGERPGDRRGDRFDRQATFRIVNAVPSPSGARGALGATERQCAA
jgi:3',5'-cyclic AMP phosphodiesterase CpdA